MVPRRILPLAALLAATGLTPLTGQETDTLPAPDTLPASASVRSPVAAPQAQPRFVLSTTMGTLGFGTLQSQPVTVRRHAPDGAVLDSARLGRSLDAEGGYRIGIGGLVSLDPTWAVRLEGAVGRTRVGARYQGPSAGLADSVARLPAQRADITLLVGEAALRMRIPSTRHARPYLEVGTAVTRWGSGPGLADAPGLEGGVRRVSGLGSAGVEVPYSDRLAGRLQATLRFARTPIDPVPAGTAGPRNDTLSVTFAAPVASPFSDGSRELVTALRLEVGISLGLGGTVAPPDDPAEPAASPSPPGR